MTMMKEKEKISVSTIQNPSNMKKKDNKSRSFRNKSNHTNNDSNDDTNEHDDPSNSIIAKEEEEETRHYHFLNDDKSEPSTSFFSSSSSVSLSKSSDLKNFTMCSQKSLNIIKDDNEHSDKNDRHDKIDQTPPNPSLLLLQQQETNHPSLTKPKQTSMKRAASSSLSPRRYRPHQAPARQAMTTIKIVRQRPIPGAHPVAGMRASELNAYRRSSLGSRITSYTRNKNENRSRTSSDDDDHDDNDDDYGSSNGIFEHDEEIGFTTSTRTITSENHRSLSLMSSHRGSGRRRRLSSTRSIRHISSSITRSIPIEMEHVTILSSNNESIVGSWRGQDEDGSSSSSSTSKSSSSSSFTTLMVDSDADTSSNHDTADEIRPVQVKVETKFETYRQWQTTSRQGRLCLVVCMLLICAILVLSITVPTLAHRKSQYQVIHNNLEESRRQHDPLRVIQTTLIEQGAVANVTALMKDTTSIEYEIVAWLAFEDPQQINATTNPDRLVQRYSARFLSMSLLERPGLVNTTKLLQVKPFNEEEEEEKKEDHEGTAGTTLSTSLSAEASPKVTTKYLNVSQHECLWSVQDIDMSLSLQQEHDQMIDMVDTDDDVLVALGDTPTTTAVTALGHAEKEVMNEQTMTNFTLGCNSQQQVTQLSLEQVTLPSSHNLTGSSSLLPFEIGNFIHLEELHLMEIYRDETNKMSFFPTNNGLYQYALPNLTILEIDMILTNDGESNEQEQRDKTHNHYVDVFEGIEHVMPNLSVLKLSGGIAPIIPNSIAKLANLIELSIQHFFNIPNEAETEEANDDSLFSNNDFFESFQSKNTLKKLDISQTQWTIPTNLGLLLPNLTHLKCSETQLTTIPSSIMDLKYLTHLDLSYNYLQSFPLSPLKSFINKLEYLDVSYNDLRGTVDMDLSKTQNVSFLNLEGNPQLNGTIICPSKLQDIEIRVPPSISCSCCSSLSLSPSLMSSPPNNVSQLLLEKRNRHRLHSST